MKQVIEALIGTKVRFARDEVGHVSDASIRACGFGSDDLYTDDMGTRSENGRKLASGIYTISHVRISTNIAGNLYVGIKEWGDTDAVHHADRFELVPNIVPEPRTEHDHPPITLGKKLKK